MQFQKKLKKLDNRPEKGVGGRRKGGGKKEKKKRRGEQLFCPKHKSENRTGPMNFNERKKPKGCAREARNSRENRCRRGEKTSNPGLRKTYVWVKDRGEREKEICGKAPQSRKGVRNKRGTRWPENQFFHFQTKGQKKGGRSQKRQQKLGLESKRHRFKWKKKEQDVSSSRGMGR